ncbi:general secretion pathway protein GspB [Allohahella marinimesophila]|uniref:Type II secretion system protein GspB C-terminal domain-containing protein n=1 Tax=Allohahella marinimesophila TaxID=1054972 RepID=A0ABP7PEJ0_9GAMM
MSYILDALRKSEQERHRDQLPQEARTRLVMPVKSPQPAGLKVLLVAILVLNVCALIGGALYLYFNREPVASPAPVPPMSPEATALPESRVEDAVPEEFLRREGRPLPQRVMPASSLTDYGSDYDAGYGEPYQEPESILPNVGFVTAPEMTQENTLAPQADAGTGDRLSDKLDARLERLRPRDTLKPLPLTPKNTATSSRPTVSYANEDGMEVIRPSSSGTAALPMPAAPSRPAPPPVESEPAPVSEQPTAPTAADINTLPADFRQQLPALTFNSHIYSSDPSSRRIMINNQYLREGQQFDSLRIREITPEGVVLFKDPYTFHVSVIRDWKP